MKTLEIWRPIDGFNRKYFVSNHGRIFSKKSNRVLAQGISNSGYKCIVLGHKGKRANYFVHRLLMSAFVPNTQKKEHINHKDMNKTNNFIGNLEWSTASENNRHWINITMKNNKLNKTQVGMIKDILELKLYTHKFISQMFGVCRATITDINNGRSHAYA